MYLLSDSCVYSSLSLSLSLRFVYLVFEHLLPHPQDIIYCSLFSANIPHLDVRVAVHSCIHISWCKYAFEGKLALVINKALVEFDKLYTVHIHITLNEFLKQAENSEDIN